MTHGQEHFNAQNGDIEPPPHPTDQELEAGIAAALGSEHELTEGELEDLDALLDQIREIRTYEDAGVMTRDRGLLLTLADGAEIQITIVRTVGYREGDRS